jgi:deoxyribose-phosphate aldolase
VWLENCYVNELAVEGRVKWIVDNSDISGKFEIAWLLKAISCIDLTTLSGDDTSTNVARLCFKVIMLKLLPENNGLLKNNMKFVLG